MKKSNYIFVILIALGLLTMSPIVYGQTTYTYAGSPGNVKILKVTTVDEPGLTNIFGSGWSDTLEAAFGVGCNVTGARSKSYVTAVNKSQYLNFGLGLMEVANITVDYWLWTTEAFNANPDYDELSLYFLKHPKNLTALTNFYTNFYLLTAYNVTVPFALGFLGQLPEQGSAFLSALDWEDDWSSVGFQIIHDATAGYVVYLYLAGIGFIPIGSMLQDCTETWTYDSTYGAFIGYKLVNSTGTTVYEFKIELSTEAAIPGFELTIILGISGFTCVTIIYIVIKKKEK